MGLFDFLQNEEALVGLDIGQSGVKLVELELSEDEKPILKNAAVVPLGEEIFSNNVVTNPEAVSEQINSLMESNNISDRRVVLAMPGPSVFTKKVKMPLQDMDDLATNLQFEAGNFIPHSLDAIKMDFHVLGKSGKNQLDVLVVAVKNEIIDSYLECASLAGLDTAIVDVDYFAIQNMYEANYPEYINDTVALVNIGSRYSAINICQGGKSLFTGDIAVGGRVFSEAISDELGLSLEEAEDLKLGGEGDAEYEAAKEIIDQQVEHVASEFNRQLSFFWNASGDDAGIDRIMISGGSAGIPGLLDEISEKTGIECQVLDPLKGIEIGEGFDPDYLKDIGPRLSVAVGLGLREIGDAIEPDFDEE